MWAMLKSEDKLLMTMLEKVTDPLAENVMLNGAFPLGMGLGGLIWVGTLH